MFSCPKYFKGRNQKPREAPARLTMNVEYGAGYYLKCRARANSRSAHYT